MNEAMLTGESVPQQKESLPPPSSPAETLDVEDGGRHKRHLVYGGTTVIDHQAGEAGEQAPGSPPPPPNGGCVCYVLKTAFGTSQGQLLRTMAFASKETSVNTTDTFVFIGMLLLFAIGAAGIVVEEGWKDKTRNRFR